jgi:hypothetical protein
MHQLHSIYLTRDLSDKVTCLPSKIVRNIDSFKDCHPELEHQLYNLELGRQFIKLHFDTDILSAFDSLRPLAYKADLLRYCLLYESGGIYADLSLYFHSSTLAFDKNAKIFVYRDGFSRAPWIASNSLIVTQPQMQVFESCIKKIVEHVNNDYYGTNALCPTGPNLFGAMLPQTTPLFEIASGEVIKINRSSGHAYAFLNAPGDVVAFSVKAGPGLSSLGAHLTDNYNDYYNDREIYSHNLNKKTWTFQELIFRGHTAKKNDEGKFPAGIAIYGPYAKLTAGTYRARFIVSQHDLTLLKQHGPYSIDACKNFGKNLIDFIEEESEDLDDGLVAIGGVFHIKEPADNLEVRLFIYQAIEFKIERLEIEKNKRWWSQA